MIGSISHGVSKVRIILEMIKFEHTVFAMPFALTSAILAANGLPRWSVLGWIVLAMVGARSAAMAFNRIVDAEFDRLNPRTAGRALPKGILKTVEVWSFTVVAAALFVFAAWSLNGLAFALSPVALIVVLGYSYTKRFTAYSHLVLGLALGIAPVGAWIGIRGRIDIAPIVLSAAVMLWTAGFDIIYALQDLDFDSRLGLFSIPKVLGARKGLLVSRLFHAMTVMLLGAYGLLLGLGGLYFAGLLVVAGVIVYEQNLVKPDDLSRVNLAFFNANGFVSMGFFVFALVDLIVRKGAF